MRRSTPSLRRTAAAFAVALLTSCVTTFEPDRSASAPVLEGFGALQLKVTTRSDAAQAWFDRGMLQAYAFNQVEAVRHFKAALAHDPDCAMCAWGVAYALGPNINATDRGNLSEAERYVALAERHASAASERERLLIQAMSARYAKAEAADPKKEPPPAPVCGSGSGGTAKADPRDIAYMLQMRALAERWPDDPDIASLYAEALMIATRDDWWDRKTGAPAPGFADMTDRLERALALAPAHTGLNHYLIHAADQSPAPQRATVAADRLGALAPESPHLLHMPAHIFVHTGRYADAERVNVEALAAELRQTKKFEAQGFGPSVNWDGHNTHFLWFSALMDGHGDVALAQARRLAERAAEGKRPTAEFMRGLPLLTLVRLERWAEALNEPAPAGDNGVAPAMSHYAHGMALARLGRRGEAEAEAKALRAAVDDPALAGKTLMGDDPAAKVLGVLAAQLDAELATPENAADGARAKLEKVVADESALEANEPPLLGAVSRLALGDLLLRQHRWSDAEAAFRAELVDQPGSGWALRGLHRALAAQGKTEAAQRAQGDLAKAWASADASLLQAAAL